VSRYGEADREGDIVTAYPSWTPAPRAGIVPLHPLTFGAILGRSFTALRRNPRVLLGFALGMQMLAYIVLIGVIGVAAFASFSRLDTLSVGSEEYDAVFAGSTAITVISGVVLGIAATALTIIVQGVVVADVAHGVISEKLSVRALWRRVRPAFWRLTGYTFLAVGVIVVVVAVLAVIVVALSNVELTVGIVLAVLLVLAAIPLTFWLTTKLFLVPQAIVLEGAGVFAAITRSWRLTRGRFWKTLGVWFLVQLTFSIIAQVVNIPFSFLSTILGSVIAPTGDADATAVIGVLVTAALSQIVTLLVQSVALVVGASAGTLLYIDARMRTEGLDHDLQSYVDQRQAGAGEADPYRWHVGREIAPAPMPAFAPAGYAPGAYPAPQSYPAPQGYPAPPAPVAAPSSPPADAAPTPEPPPASAPSTTDWAAPGGSDQGR
jgi:hypothetical protein